MDDKRAGRWQLGLVLAFLVAAIVISRLLQSGHAPVQRDSGEDRPLAVAAVQLQPGPYRITFTTTGVVEARTTVNVVPEVSGRVIDVHPDFYTGGRFDAHERLFAIDPRDYELEIERMEAEVARAQTALNLEQAEAEAALAEWRQSQGKTEPPDLVARKPQLAEAEANLQAAQAGLASARLNLQRSQFRLPFSGRVMHSDAAPGQYLVAGQPAGQVFDMASLEIRVSLEDRQLTWLQASDDPDIRIVTRFMGQTQTHAGVLRRGAATLDTTTRFAAVQVGFANDQHPLVPGVFAEVHIRGPEFDNVLQLPATALQKGGRVWEVTGDGTLASWQPQVVHSSEDTVAVEGIGRPVLVVTSRLAGASEGSRVTIDEGAAGSGAADTGVQQAGQP